VSETRTENLDRIVAEHTGARGLDDQRIAAQAELSALLSENARLRDALGTLVQVVEQLIPEESVRGVANVVLFQARALLSPAAPGGKEGQP